MAAGADSKGKWLLGREDATIDDKGRVLFSKRKRDLLGDGFVMVFGDRSCVDAYPEETWDRMVAQVMDQDRSVEARETFLREVLGYAYDGLGFDPQGRAVVPRQLREIAKLEGELLLIGCGDHVEIWSAAEHATMQINPRRYGRERFEMLHEARAALHAVRWEGYDQIPR